jgi:PEP-CTERM/exosortase A-associated glycosyltransferase
MRILHILDHSAPLQSGYTFRTLAILKAQHSMGWETYQLTGRKHAATVSEEIVGSMRFLRTPTNGPAISLPVAREIAQMQALGRRIEEVAEEIRPDILHAHSPVLNAIPALRAGRRMGIPVVYEVRAFWEDAAADHGTSVEGGLRYRATRALETWALKRADAVTTICEGLRGEIVARGVPTERVTVIPNAVDTAEFTADGKPDAAFKSSLGLDGAIVLGFVGSFYAYEGLELLLEAMPAIIERLPHARILLVGGGPEEQRLKAIAEASGIKDYVRFAGRVPHADVQRYYDLIDVLVYPRFRMRLTDLVTPLKPLEAMAQKKLLIASDVGGHRELIRDGVTGILFAAGDSAALARAVIDLVGAESSWTALREAGRHFVETERTWGRSVARYRDVYANAAARYPNRAGPAADLEVSEPK